MTLDAAFALTDHACRHCLGRILERNGVFMCSVCEVSATGNVAAICGCGMRSASSRDLPKGLSGAYKCAINQERSVINPARIVVSYGGAVVHPLAS